MEKLRRHFFQPGKTAHITLLTSFVEGKAIRVAGDCVCICKDEFPTKPSTKVFTRPPSILKDTVSVTREWLQV